MQCQIFIIFFIFVFASYLLAFYKTFLLLCFYISHIFFFSLFFIKGQLISECTFGQSSYELRRCVPARTRAMCGRTCACEIHSGKCAGCACVRPFFGRAMCDRTFAHFLGQNCQKMLHFRTSFPVLEHLFLFWIILFCFRTHLTIKMLKSC